MKRPTESGGDQVVGLEDIRLEVPGRTLLTDINISISRGDTVAIMGPSGGGKTSLINCVAGIKAPAKGKVRVSGQVLGAMKESERAQLRLSSIGMVFQFGELLPELTVSENVALPMMLLGWHKDEIFSRVATLVHKLGLSDLSDTLPQTLSGGEVQRAAIARALSVRPLLVLADEPTGALDEATAQLVTELLLQNVAENDAGLLLATHNRSVAQQCSRRFIISDGSLKEDHS